MRRIAVINQKGGVGKTTTTANLGAALARMGKRVLLIDLDPQGHLGLHFGLDVRDDQATIYDVVVNEAPLSEVIVGATDGLDLAPSNIDLAGAETELVSVLGRELLLRDAIAPFEADYDCLLIDCPPSLGILTINALVAARELLIPLQAQFFALQGFSKLLDKTVRLVCQRINPDLKVLGVALCMHETNTRLSGEVADDIRSFLEASRDTPTAWSNASVFDAYIRRNIKLAEASSFGQSVFDYAPKSNGAIDYQRLAVEIFGEGIESRTEPGETDQAGSRPAKSIVDKPRQARVGRSVDRDAASNPPAATAEIAASALTVPSAGGHGKSNGSTSSSGSAGTVSAPKRTQTVPRKAVSRAKPRTAASSGDGVVVPASRAGPDPPPPAEVADTVPAPSTTRRVEV